MLGREVRRGGGRGVEAEETQESQPLFGFK